MENVITNKLKAGFKNLAIVWVLILLIIVIALIEPLFLSPLNIITILRQVTIISILTMGITFVLITGGIDLSVGSNLAFTSVVVASISKIDGMPLIVAIFMAIIFGGLLGVINGIGVAYGNVPAFIMTLGTMISWRGAAMLITRATPIIGLPESFMGIAGTDIFSIGGVKVPSMVLFFFAVLFISLFLLKKTVYGKWIYSVGGSEIAARYSGIKTKRVIMSVYIVSGLFAGLAGVLMTSRLNSGISTVGETFALDGISAAVIGGVSLSGGVGKVWRAVIGTLIIGTLQNGLHIMTISPFVQSIIQGAIIVVAVFVDMNMKRVRT